MTCQVPITLTSKIRRQTSGEAASRSEWGITAGGAGIVDQDVEAAVAGDHLIDQPGRLRLIGHVGLQVGRSRELGGERGARPRPSATELTTTVAPREANRRAVAAPMPEDEPVMSATWPASGVEDVSAADMERV